MGLFSNEILIQLGNIFFTIVIMISIYLVVEDQISASDRSERVFGGGAEAKRRLRLPFLRSKAGSGFEDQLIEALLMISSSLKAGRNLDQAFELVAISTPAPLCDEFRTLVSERRLGVPIVEALTNLARRVPSQDLRLAVNATIFQQETGGNLEDLYKQIVIMVSERKKIMGKVRAGTAHARLSGIMVGIIPWVFFTVMVLTNRSYLKPMLESPWGWFMGLAALVSSVVGLMFIYRMTSGILPDADESMVRPNDSRTIRKWQMFRPLLQFAASINSRFHGSIFEKMRQDIRYRLALAGNSANFTPDEFIGVKKFCGLVLVALAVLSTNLIKYGVSTPFLMAGIFLLGFQIPSIYLAQRIRMRQMNIEYELPYMIDLLSLAIEAGLDLVGGIQKIVEKSRPTDIVMEFSLFLSDIKVGKAPEEAMSEMAERVQILSFFSFVSSLIQAQRLGAEIGPTLRAQAEQMRYQRMIIAEEQMNQLPVKLLIPLVFFIFPSIFILVLGPTVLHFMNVFWKPMAEAAQ